ncbi:hypothetical protein IT407_01275 [Candidatus Uhrbacteria bacterium]|nr:hypothetical protein [Candidatus Uhrbacteria bacterium]
MKRGNKHVPKKSAPTRSTSSWFNKVLVIVVGALAIMFAYGHFHGRGGTTRSRRAHASPPSHRSLPETPNVNEIRRAQYALLRSIVDEDAEGRELLEFFGSYARYGILLGDGMMTDIPTVPEGMPSAEGDPMNFTVVVSTQRQRMENGINSISPWEFLHEHALLFVPPNWSDQSDQVAGAVFAHELRHAFDHARGIQPVRATPREVIEGELRAYSLEIRLLNLANAGRVDSVLGSIIASRTEWTEDPEACVLMGDLRDEEKQDFIDAFHGIRSEDLSPLIVLLPIGLNQRLAESHSSDLATRAECLERYLEDQARRARML